MNGLWCRGCIGFSRGGVCENDLWCRDYIGVREEVFVRMI